MSAAAPHRPTMGQALSRALKLRCPRCGEGKLFVGFFRMHPRCSSCGLRFERAPGYFLGSAYVNYAATALAVTLGYMLLHVGARYSNRQLALPLAGFCVLFPLFFFRYARALWLAMDCFLDPTGFDPAKD
jgi:uncharacterized protein (DUF983 family)